MHSGRIHPGEEKAAVMQIKNCPTFSKEDGAVLRMIHAA
jgi:hypothetical protein